MFVLMMKEHGILEESCLQCGAGTNQREAVSWIEAERLTKRNESQSNTSARISKTQRLIHLGEGERTTWNISGLSPWMDGGSVN